MLNNHSHTGNAILAGVFAIAGACEGEENDQYLPEENTQIIYVGSCENLDDKKNISVKVPEYARGYAWLESPPYFDEKFVTTINSTRVQINLGCGEEIRICGDGINVTLNGIDYQETVQGTVACAVIKNNGN